VTGERATVPRSTLEAGRRSAIPRPATPADDATVGPGESGGHSEAVEETVRALFGRLATAPHGSPAWQGCRDELVRRHLPLVHFLARRFLGRGEPLDDLVQVATIGLIKAVDRFDLARGVEFSTYATPTILGEVKRHFRDRGWAIRVPRRIQEQLLAVSQATGVLFGQLSRSPTVAELAAYTGLSEEQVLETIESSHAHTAVSLDAGTHPDWDGEQPSRHLPAGDAEAALENVEHRASLRPLLSRLDPRERHILLLRFFANMTQSEIAAEVGVSQMHVSRLLGRTLARLREGLTHPE